MFVKKRPEKWLPAGFCEIPLARVARIKPQIPEFKSLFTPLPPSFSSSLSQDVDVFARSGSGSRDATPGGRAG